MTDNEVKEIEQKFKMLRSKFDVVSWPSCGISQVKHNNKSFHVDLDGNRIYTDNYDYVGGFSEDIGSVKKHGLLWHIDKKGNPIYKEKYLDLCRFEDSMAWVCNFEGKWAQINRDGEVIGEWKEFN